VKKVIAILAAALTLGGAFWAYKTLAARGGC
jgi:hypothetical protein